jgi:membrane fusion protein (multidrug efflux system)
MRKFIISWIAVVIIIVISFYLYTSLGDSKKETNRNTELIKKTVFTTKVKNNVVPIVIQASGNLIAKNKVELFAEVQGVLETYKKEFRTGIQFREGEVIIKINSDEHFATLQAQKSSLQSLITSIMPDIKLDYSDSYNNWNTYLNSFGINSYIDKLPEPKSEKERYFITGRNIYNSYYNVKNLEARLRKYSLVAPFDGILTETQSNRGTLVRSGQKLGEFINVDVFELPLSVNAIYANSLKAGKNVKLYNADNTQNWVGKVLRINGKINQETQTVQVFIEIRGKNLREGLYLQADVETKQEANAIEIDRKLLVNNESVYIVKDTILQLMKVTPIHFNKKTVVIGDIPNGSLLVSKIVSGAYDGMPVTIFKENLIKQ